MKNAVKKATNSINVKKPLLEANLDVWQFLDFRAFLMSHAAMQRKKHPHWSYGSWAKRLGMKQTATLTRIVNGQRTPGAKVLKALERYFNFTPAQLCYFRNLVLLSKIKQEAVLTEVVTLEISEDHLEEAKNLIRKFQKTILKVFGKNFNNAKLYQLKITLNFLESPPAKLR